MNKSRKVNKSFGRKNRVRITKKKETDLRSLIGKSGNVSNQLILDVLHHFNENYNTDDDDGLTDNSSALVHGFSEALYKTLQGKSSDNMRKKVEEYTQIFEEEICGERVINTKYPFLVAFTKTCNTIFPNEKERELFKKKVLTIVVDTSENKDLEDFIDDGDETNMDPTFSRKQYMDLDLEKNLKFIEEAQESENDGKTISENNENVASDFSCNLTSFLPKLEENLKNHDEEMSKLYQKYAPFTSKEHEHLDKEFYNKLIIQKFKQSTVKPL